MKKILFLLPFIGSSLLQAQKFEVSAAYGTPSVYGVGNMFADALVNIGTNSEEISGSNGVLNINALVYNHNMKWRYGLEFNVEFFEKKSQGYSTSSFISVLPRVDYFWSAADKKLRLYSGASAGILFSNGKYTDYTSNTKKNDNTAVFGFNIMPLGLRYGKDFGVFIEPNIGTRGFVNAGVSYIFL